MRIKVAEGVSIAHEAKVFKSGKTVDAPDEFAQSWINAGLASAVEESKAKKTGVTVERKPTAKTARKTSRKRSSK